MTSLEQLFNTSLFSIAGVLECDQGRFQIEDLMGGRNRSSGLLRRVGRRIVCVLLGQSSG